MSAISPDGHGSHGVVGLSCGEEPMIVSRIPGSSAFAASARFRVIVEIPLATSWSTVIPRTSVRIHQPRAAPLKRRFFR